MQVCRAYAPAVCKDRNRVEFKEHAVDLADCLDNVEIETEWNLKTISCLIPCDLAPVEYRNIMEFKDHSHVVHGVC